MRRPSHNNYDKKILQPVAFLRRKALRITVCLILSITLAYLVLNPYRFAASYRYIPNADIPKYLVPATHRTNQSCPVLPSLSLEVNKILDYELRYNAMKYGSDLMIQPGGSWAPENCKALYSVAIIIPFRKRQSQLDTFLHYIHPFLQKQLLNYTIFVVEQTYSKPFNRGMLLNIGYVEAMKLHKYHCFIFHDVDLLPLVEQNIYACTEKPRHMSSAINLWRYQLLYQELFGGASAMLQVQFSAINGYSNLYFGWGGEDDDIYKRLKDNDLDICRFSTDIAKYYMLPHAPEMKNPERTNILADALNRYSSDGLNSLRYTRMFLEKKSLYTHVVVDL